MEEVIYGNRLDELPFDYGESFEQIRIALQFDLPFNCLSQSTIRIGSFTGSILLPRPIAERKMACPVKDMPKFFVLENVLWMLQRNSYFVAGCVISASGIGLQVLSRDLNLDPSELTIVFGVAGNEVHDILALQFVRNLAVCASQFQHVQRQVNST